MAQIDIKEATVKIFDGTLGTATLAGADADGGNVYTAKSKHIGSDKISVTHVKAAGTVTLSVVVTDREIVVNLATTSGTVTSTGADVKTAIEAAAAAAALVTVAITGTGLGLGAAVAKTTLDGQKVLSVKIGEGNLTYSEKRPVEFKRDRGALDTVKNADEEPIDVSLDATWEWLSSESGATTPTIEEALKNSGAAVAWVTTADDTCQPYCVDIEVWNAAGCAVAEDELIVLEEYYYENLDHDLREGTIAMSGRCNRTQASLRRVPNASIA